MSDKKYNDFAAVLVFLVVKGKVLLAQKKDKIGKGCWNGYGGEIEKSDSSIKAAAVREFMQKSKAIIIMDDLREVAIGFFGNIEENGEKFLCKVRIFISGRSFGELKESSEMSAPKWFDCDDLPEKMNASYKVWLPEVLKGRKLIIKATMKNNQQELVGDVEIIPVASLR